MPDAEKDAGCPCGHPTGDHDDGACMHLCDCAWPDAEKDRPRLPEGVRLTSEESEVARRWFEGEATEDELRQVIGAHVDRLVANGVIPPGKCATGSQTDTESADRGGTSAADADRGIESD